MKLTSQVYSEDQRHLWDEFVFNKSRNGTFLHSRIFLNCTPQNRREDASLLFLKGSTLIGILPACLQNKGHLFYSHPRATYGGFVFSSIAGIRDILEMVDLSVDFARHQKVNEIKIRNPFWFLSEIPSEEPLYALWHRGFRTENRELQSTIDLRRIDPKAVLGSFDSKTRNQVRKAEKSGIQVKESADFSEFWKILSNHLEAKHKTQPTHSLQEIDALKQVLGPDKIKLFVATFDNVVVAGLCAFIVNARVVHAQYIASRDDFHQMCPVNAVISHIIQWAVDRNFHYFNFGVSTENDGKEINFGLFQFKEGFGARGTLRDTLTLRLKNNVQGNLPMDRSS